MPHLPEELVGTIVSQVIDLDCLKRCSLVNLTFRNRSQCILLHSLTLTSGSPHPESPRFLASCALLRESPRDPSAVCMLLKDSPHIAGYITRWTINIYPNPTPVFWEPSDASFRNWSVCAASSSSATSLKQHTTPTGMASGRDPSSLSLRCSNFVSYISPGSRGFRLLCS